MEAFDYIVIGGGSGGIASARRAAHHGAKVALIERGELGGTCVNVGCVPKKIMFNAAGLALSLHDASNYGLNLDFHGVDWEQLKARRDQAVARLRGIYQRNLETSGVRVIPGTARMTGPHTVAVSGATLQAPHVLIATGSRAMVPVIPGATLGGTSDDFFRLTEQPKRIAVVGAGYIAVELASMLAALGSGVTLLYRHQRLLGRFDPMLSDALGSELQADGVELKAETTVVALTPDVDGLITIETGQGQTLPGFDVVLWAIGRGALTQGLGLEAASVELTPEGRIRVDDFQNTSTAGIYAVGDVASAVALTPAAIASGRRLSDRLFGGETGSKVDLSEVATVVFTHPPIGTVGLSEVEACKRFGAPNIRVYESRFTNLYYAVTDQRRPTSMKIVTRLPEEKVLGVHVIGLGADELIQGFAVAVKMGATKADFDRTLAIHPTAAEEMLTMTRSRMGVSAS